MTYFGASCFCETHSWETARTDAAGRDGVALRENDYRAIRRCAETYRESLFVRLCGKSGSGRPDLSDHAGVVLAPIHA